MRIHLITNLFAPDELAGAALFSDFALYLKGRGHDVRVTCTFSYYPAWRLRSEDMGVRLREETYHGVPVRRVGMYIPSQPTGKSRMISDASFLLSLLRRGRFPGWLPDVVVTASPMFSQCLAQRFLYLGRRIPRLVIVQDFVVDAALELGILRLPGLSGVLRAAERWSFRAASTLTTISDPMLAKLRGIVGPDRRLAYIPNWIHGSLEAMVERIGKEGLPRARKRLLYSGNLGIKQGLPDFLPLFSAARTRADGEQEANWVLQIHGGGAEAARLREVAVGQAGLSVGGVLDEMDYVRALLTCSACLITQRPGVGANFLPSKVLPALATGTPVLAVCEADTPLGREVLEGGFGVVVPPLDVERLVEVLRDWGERPEQLVELGRRAAERSMRYRRDAVLCRFEEELCRLVPREERSSD